MKTITYVLRSGDYYKIGKTTRIKKRLQAYNTHNPDVSLVHKLDGDYEKELHEYFSHKRHKLEWFRLTDEDIIFIKADLILKCSDKVMYHVKDIKTVEDIIKDKKGVFYTVTVYESN